MNGAHLVKFIFNNKLETICHLTCKHPSKHSSSQTKHRILTKLTVKTYATFLKGCCSILLSKTLVFDEPNCRRIIPTLITGKMDF